MSSKQYSLINVYDATQERLKYIFGEFDNVLVAFSGGKDSGVMLNIAYEYANEIGQLNKLGMYFLDYEAQYEKTIQYVHEEFQRLSDIKRYWLCLPNSVPTATSMKENLWIPWENSKKDIWVRPMPTNNYVINQFNVPWDYKVGERDYKVQKDFTRWFAKENGRTAVLIAIRADESMDRYRAIKSQRKINGYKQTNYINKTAKDVYNAYPLYDWKVEDIWISNAKHGFKYNSIYDLYFQAGIKVNEMRVASPFLSEGLDNLKYYQIIEPDTWGKMLGRVNGVNFAGIYGGTTAMGWKNIKLPPNMTWKSYLEFLLKTLPESTRRDYEKIFATSIEFWKSKGGVLDSETINDLKKAGIDINVGNQTNYKTSKKPVTFNDYPDDAPIKNFKAVPSYKRMCITIMKNDHTAKYMGFSQTKAQIERRRKAIEKYKNIL